MFKITVKIIVTYLKKSSDKLIGTFIKCFLKWSKVDAKIEGIWGGMGKTSLTSENLQVLQSLQYAECHYGSAYIFIICTKKICLKQYLIAIASDCVCSALKLSVQVPCTFEVLKLATSYEIHVHTFSQSFYCYYK